MNEIAFQSKIQQAAHNDEDIQLVESLYTYFLFIKEEDFISWKKLKSLFLAARPASKAWQTLDIKEAKAVQNVLKWTGYTPDLIAQILRTYDRATQELKQALGDGRIGRYPASTISRLHKGNLKDLQSRVLEMYFRYAMTNDDLRELVQKLERTLSKDDQEKILAKYIQAPPFASLETSPIEKQSGSSSEGVGNIYLLRKITLNELQKLTEDELRELEKETEILMPKASSILKTSLKHIREEMMRKLSAKMKNSE